MLIFLEIFQFTYLVQITKLNSFLREIVAQKHVFGKRSVKSFLYKKFCCLCVFIKINSIIFIKTTFVRELNEYTFKNYIHVFLKQAYLHQLHTHLRTIVKITTYASFLFIHL